jgi:hypothetical protein
MAMGACAASTTDEGNGGESPTTSSGSPGGMGGMAQGGGGADGGMGGESPCPIDCSTIMTDQCQEAVCNVAQQACEVVALDDGTTCDDGTFCTLNDTCQAGVCTGGGQNDCGNAVEACTNVTCDEATQTCGTEPAGQGDPCQPADLCVVNAACNNGLCVGGTTNDCFFAPVPDDCHIAVCNPMNGMCEPQPGNDGQGCVDAMALCMVGNTCTGGVCQGGAPLDCSQLTVGCFDGQCDTATGQCIQVPIMPGQQCQEATDQCNVGICDMMGVCNATPANEGQNCDTDGCFVGQTCGTGTCQGGAETTTCTNNDNCCPAGCDLTTDDDCGCDFALISNETQLNDPTITGLITANGHTFVNFDNNNTGTHTGNAALLSQYETIILHEHDRLLNATEMNNLITWVQAGGSLLVTGYDSLGSPTDANMAAVVNCTNPSDGPFSNMLSVVNSTHPIMQGPAQAFTMGMSLTAGTTDHDTCGTGTGAVPLITVSTTSKLIVTDNVGMGNGTVLYWNANGTGSGPLVEWDGTGGTQPDLQNLFVNVLDHMCQ